MKKQDNPFCKIKVKCIDFRDVHILNRFINPSGRILSRRQTGCSSRNQRQIGQAIKRARYMGFMPYIKH